MVNLITEHIDIWTAAQIRKANGGRGRGKNSNGKSSHGIKKLRELILGLAVRGKLVPQDTNNEPASVLLEKIAKEKKRLFKEGKIKKQKKLPEISEDETPFKLPESWEWTRLGSISQINPRNVAEDNITTSFIPMHLISTSHTGEHGQEIKTWGEIKKGYTHFADGDIGVAKITPCFENSKAVVLSGLENGIGAGTTELHIARPYDSTLVPRYILLFLKAPMFLYLGETKMTGTAGQKRVPKAFFSETPLPLPPLSEQHRIVAKVDELMAICDQLEQQQTDSNATHETLVETLLAALTKVADQDEFAKTWQQIVDHFDALFTTEQSVDQIKQTILQLAVMGKLVPQDPNDEPASVLMENLTLEREKWLEKNAKKNKECKTMQNKLKKLKSAKPPFSIPSTWECIHLIQVARMLVDCHNKTAPYVENGIPIIRTSNIRERKFRLNDIKFVNEDTYVYWSRRCPPKPQDIFFTREAPMGEAAIIPKGKKYCLGQRTMLIRPMHEFIFNKYLLLALTEPHLLVRASEYAIGSTVKHLRVGDVENLNIPIPPLAEQYRIVAKVDELMAFCDDLKNRLINAQITQVKLADSIVEQAVAQ